MMKYSLFFFFFWCKTVTGGIKRLSVGKCFFFLSPDSCKKKVESVLCAGVHAHLFYLNAGRKVLNALYTLLCGFGSV